MLRAEVVFDAFPPLCPFLVLGFSPCGPRTASIDCRGKIVVVVVVVPRVTFQGRASIHCGGIATYALIVVVVVQRETVFICRRG